MRRLLACFWATALAGIAAAQVPAGQPAIQDPEAHAERGRRLKAAIDAGHRWLKAHQDPDGRFSASTFVVHDPRDQPTDGPGKPDQDVFVTALVVTAWSGMAWLPDAGGEDGKGTHPHVVRATEWLFSQVQKDGSIGPAGSTTLVRDTAAAAEVLHWSGVYFPDWSGRWPREVTTDWLRAHRRQDGRWPRRPAGGGGGEGDEDRDLDWATDMLVTSCLMSTGAKGVQGNGPFAFGDKLRKCTDAEAGGAAYVFAWSLSNPGLRADACRQALRNPPRVHVRKDAVDYLGWYGATQGMQFEAADAWRTWWHALVDTAVTMQRTDGSFAGSWDPLDVRGRECGRVYATAAVLLALEVAWRKEYRDR